LTAVDGFLDFSRVEYPLGYSPPSYIPFEYRKEDDELFLLYEATEGEDEEDCLVSWCKYHTCDETSGTIPATYEETLVRLVVAKLLEGLAITTPSMANQALVARQIAEEDLRSISPETKAVKAVFRSQW
jgi:hypothetical protein